MIRRSAWFSALVACTAPPASAPAPQAAPPRAYELARSLADEVGPRSVGSPGDAAAVAWALRTMQRLGFARVHAEPVTAPGWQRGVERADVVGQPLAVTALGWSPAGDVEAEVLEVDSIAALQALEPSRVAGKIVFYNHPIERRRDGMGYGEGVATRFAGPPAAAALGAVAVLVRSVGTGGGDAPHTGATARDVPLPSAALGITDAEKLHAMPGARVHLVLGPRLLGDVQTANVVGDVLGSSKPNEIVLLGAHLDSWDLARGAVDDGAGCGIVLAAGAGLHQPRRTVRVVLFAAEENSGAGGKAYAAAHGSEPHVLAYEADTGSGAPWALRVTTDPAHGPAFLAVAERVGLPAETEPAFGGSDIAPLRALGVPVFDVRQDLTRYFDVHHTKNDVVAELDAAALARTVAVVTTVAQFAADAVGDQGRVPERSANAATSSGARRLPQSEASRFAAAPMARA